MLELAALLDEREALVQRVRGEQEAQAEALKAKCVHCIRLLVVHVGQWGLHFTNLTLQPFSPSFQGSSPASPPRKPRPTRYKP